ncbi:MAG: DNA polymerase III, subunit gamma and tau [Chloroflexi bacterium RBG_13_68_17]|nr:MAG: DNA polymerase III, subunit gamma and tau [Chloroflexi bacterium RBG_13_68_17]
MTQALYRKWRPRSWDEVVGQEHIVQTLRNAIRAGRVAHAYLFAGPRGTGKTTTARLLAKAVNCQSASLAERPCNRCAHCQAVNEGRFLDLIEIDAASNTSVEDVRDLRDKINFAPNEGEYKVYIVDEVHMLSTAAFNALLKTLEEPPPHAIFVLATTEVHKIPATVLSRCQRHEFRRLSVDAMVAHLQAMLKQEGMRTEAGVLELVARQATGSLRDAISLLDQLASSGEIVTLAQAQVVLGTAAGEAVHQVVGAWLKGDLAGGLTEINRTLDSGADPRQFARQIVDYLRGLLLIRMGTPGLVETTAETRAEMEAQSAGVAVAALLAAIRSFNRAASEARAGWQPGLPLEMALLEAVRGPAPEAEPAAANPAAALRPAASPRARGAGGRRTGGAPEASAQARPDEPSVAPAPPGRSGSITLQTVLDHWREILGAVRQRDPRTQALLNSSRPLGLEGGVLVLGFASDLLRDKMEKGHSLALVQEALLEVLGSELEIRSALAGGRASPPSQEESAPPVGNAGMVAAALRDLGAQVVDVKPALPEDRPPDV